MSFCVSGKVRYSINNIFINIWCLFVDEGFVDTSVFLDLWSKSYSFYFEEKI